MESISWGKKNQRKEWRCIDDGKEKRGKIMEKICGNYKEKERENIISDSQG